MHGQNRHESRILFGNPDGNRAVGRRKICARVILKCMLEKIWRKDVKLIHLVQNTVPITNSPRRDCLMLELCNRFLPPTSINAGDGNSEVCRNVGERSPSSR